MSDIIDGQKLEADILKDMRVELTEEFDKNFQRKAFFTDAWKPRKDKKALGYQVKSHQRRFNMPQRQFIGDGKETQQLIKDVIDDNLQAFSLSMSNFISSRIKKK